jgi:HD-GYP domain-containing protein (c-di-GMP phosphodiesterase class II)
LAGQLITAGELPFNRAKLSKLSDPLLAPTSVDQWVRVRTPDSTTLARECGGEVLTEPIVHGGMLIGTLMAGNKRGADPDISSEDLLLLGTVAEYISAFHGNVARLAEQHELFFGTVRALTGTIDAKDPYTRGHSERVGMLAEKLAFAIGLNSHQSERYRIAGLVHDLGKIGVPEAVLRKPGKLTDEEFGQIKLHPEIGHRILCDIRAMADILPGVLHHHEKWNGNGYPHRLSGEAIPLIARVLALADTFDAMCSSRAYRMAIERHQVLAEIQRCGGSQFDPALAPVFASLDFSDFDQMLIAHQPQMGAAA